MVKSKYKKILLVLVILFLTISNITRVYAQVNTMTTDPNVIKQELKAEGVGYIFQVGIPGIVGANAKLPITGLGTLVNGIITLAYRIAMLLVLYKIVSIGFKYMTSKGNADIVSSVSKGMKNVLIGILILFGSYLILRTINPDLTKIPQNINCPKGTAICDDATGSNYTQNKVACPLPGGTVSVDNRTADELENDMGIGSDKSMFDDGITEDEVNKFISSNYGSLYQSGDWTNAKKDLLSGKVSTNIWSAIKKLIENKNNWLSPDCWDKIEFGPIYTGHVKAGDYESCHDSYDAVDLVVRDGLGNHDRDAAKACMEDALTYLRAYVSEVTACDERECPPPHIHIQDVNCKVGCRVCP